MAPVVKNLPANAGDERYMGSTPGLENPLEKEMATYSSILAWTIPWTEEPGRCLLVAQMVKNLPAIQETWVQSLAQEDPLEKVRFTK